MATLLILAGLAGGALILSSGSVAPRPEQSGNLSLSFQQYRQDLEETGISWGTQRAWVQHMTDLNDVWKPRAAPSQKSTNSVMDVFEDQAEIDSYLSTYAPPFFLRADPQITINTPQQGLLNIEIPTKGVSFQGDTNNFCASYPRVYADYATPAENPHIFTGMHDTLGEGEPTESEELNVPISGHLNFLWNPYGPGGSQQRIQARRGEEETIMHGAIGMSHILGYPQTRIQSGKLQ